VWDDARRALQIANSGLPRPVSVRDGKLEVIEATGLPLGLFSDAQYEALKIESRPGDLFVFFSDGLIDARNRSGELFGRTRLHELVLANIGKTAEEIADVLFNTVQEHATGMAAFDDQTVVVLRVR
jgi:sigma-B regulation protein RsbU (phosphoserine phosphatase)